MPAEIPAWLHARVREEGVHAGLRGRRVKDKLSLSILLQHRVRVAHYDRTIGVAIGGEAQTKHSKINGEGQHGRAQSEEQDAKKDPPQPLSQFGSGQRNEAKL